MDSFSLFSPPDNIPAGNQAAFTSACLDVVKADFIETETMSWQELFSGFDTLHAITFSSGIRFVYQLLDLFSTADIIFGCEDVISYSLQEVMAYQSKLLDRIKDTANKAKLDLMSRVDCDSLHFHVAREKLSHEKIYLLSANDGRRRVIMGSANMSFNAFGGKQRENICYMDSDRAYDWYMNCWNELREHSTDQIFKEALVCADSGENLEELPISRTVRANKALVVEVQQEQKEEVCFALDIKTSLPSLPLPSRSRIKKGRFSSLRRKSRSSAVR